MLITALATPFKEGKPDKYSYERLVAFQKDAVDALLAVGTTAEAMLLTECEKKLLITLAKGVAPLLPLWVGVENADTVRAVAQAKTAEDLGANGVLVAPPAFVKCTPCGYVKHISAICDAVKLPVMLYNAPSRCGYELNKNAVSELADRVRFVKDAGGDVGYTAWLSDKFFVLCGNDERLLQMLKAGAKGAVSVVSNVAPELVKRVLYGNASAEQKELFARLARLSMLELNPIATKYMLYKKGVFDSYEVRLPLSQASEETRRQADEIDWEKVK